MTAEEAAAITLSIWGVGVAIGIVVVAFLRQRGRWAGNGSEYEETAMMSALFCVFIWPLIALTAVLSIPIVAPFLALYALGAWLGKRGSSA